MNEYFCQFNQKMIHNRFIPIFYPYVDNNDVLLNVSFYNRLQSEPNGLKNEIESHDANQLCCWCKSLKDELAPFKEEVFEL